jgi:glycosyltransferase involved in cell wall biosynthesis
VLKSLKEIYVFFGLLNLMTSCGVLYSVNVEKIMEFIKGDAAYISGSFLSFPKPPLLLCLSHLRWDFVFQRPQHLLSRATRNFRVVFLEEPVGPADGDSGALPRLETRITPQGVMVATPVLPPGLDARTTNLVQTGLLDGLLQNLGGELAVAWYYTPMFLPIAGHLQPAVTVYDCMDELSLFRGASPQLQLLERRLLKAADLVFAGGRSLFDSKRVLHPNVQLFPSSVDAGHFRLARSDARPADPADQAHLPHPRLGYFGVIDERMDLPLLAAIADQRPDWQIIMLGPVVKVDCAALPRRPNLHWLGGKHYAELPAYLGHWDVGLMPFALNESTRFISPTKTPEYLAAGVPVVSTPIADVVRDWGQAGLVEIAGTAETAIAAAEAVMVRPSGDWLAKVDQRLAQTSWDRTWSDMNARISKLLSPQMQAREAAHENAGQETAGFSRGPASQARSPANAEALSSLAD